MSEEEKKATEEKAESAAKAVEAKMERGDDFDILRVEATCPKRFEKMFRLFVSRCCERLTKAVAEEAGCMFSALSQAMKEAKEKAAVEEAAKAAVNGADE